MARIATAAALSALLGWPAAGLADAPTTPAPAPTPATTPAPVPSAAAPADSPAARAGNASDAGPINATPLSANLAPALGHSPAADSARATALTADPVPPAGH